MRLARFTLPMLSIGLASQSPRRRELLAQIGVKHKVVRVDVPELRAPAELPIDYVRRLAKAKALAGAGLVDFPVLGADTVVVCEGQVLEKPTDQADFLRMMSVLSGATHEVITGVALATGDAVEVLHCVSEVVFAQVSQAQAAEYWATGEPADKAGGYGIQGYGAALIAGIVGSYSNVVGLPLFETAQLLKRNKIPIWNPKPDE